MITWLVSYPKSGNTWARMFLAAYKNNGYLNINRPEGFCWDDCGEYFYQTVCAMDIRDLTREQLILLRPAALLHMICSNYAGDMVVKTHCSNAIFSGIDLIPKQLTKKALYIIRDPRDMIISWAAHTGHDIDQLAEDISKPSYIATRGPLFTYLGSWSTHVKTWAKEKNFPVSIVRYEDMIKAPEAVFRAILDFLGIEYEEARFYAALEATTFDALKKQEEEKGFRERKGEFPFFRVGKAGTWKEILSDQQVEKLHEAHEEVMSDFGYV